MQSLPTLKTIYDGIIADMNAQFGDNISTLKKVALRVLAAVFSGQMWLFYKVVAFLQRQVWPDTADSESRGGTLERFGRTRLGRNPFPAVAGQYTVQVTGTVGAIIPAQITGKSDDSSANPGKLFILDNQHTLISSPDTITVRALTPGLGAKLNIGDKLNFTSPIALVNSSCVVTAESVQPLAAESIEDYRAKVVASYRLEAQGGAAADLRLWSLDAQGVRTVYPYAKPGETNANNIYVEANPADSTDGKGTPSSAMLTAVNNVINFHPDTSLSLAERGRRPNTVINYILPPTIINVDIQVLGFVGITSAQQTQIINALTAALFMIRPYVAACDNPIAKNDIIDVNKINGIIYSQIPSANYTGVVLKINTVTQTTYTFVAGNIGYMNSVTFI